MIQLPDPAARQCAVVGAGVWMVAPGTWRLHSILDGLRRGLAGADTVYPLRDDAQRAVHDSLKLVRCNGGDGIVRIQPPRYLHRFHGFLDPLVIQYDAGKLELFIDLCSDLFRFFTVNQYIFDWLIQAACSIDAVRPFWAARIYRGS